MFLRPENNRFSWFKLWWAVCCAGLLGWHSPVFSAETLVILYSSEHHGVALPLTSSDGGLIGGLSRRAMLVEEIREEGHPVIVLDSGDILIGTAFSSWFKGEPDILAMNAMGYSGMVAGNHDFDFGVGHLSRLIELARFPVLCTNLIAESLELPCQSSAVIRVKGWTVGLLGIVGRSNFPDTFSREVVRFLKLEDSLQAVQREAKALRQRQDVDLIVLLTHQDTEEDLQLLNQAIDVDVMIGCHTEGFDGLYAPGREQPVASLKYPERVFVKTHRQGRFLGRLDLTKELRAVSYARARNIPVTESIPVHSGVEVILDTYRQRFIQEASHVVGRSLVRLNGERPAVRTQETNMGNLLADRLRASLHTDVALINGGQIRGSIDAGPVTLGDVLEVLPFDSSLVSLEVTGSVLQQVLEHGVSQWPNHSGRFLQVAGLQVTFDMAAPPGRRVREVVVGGRPLDPHGLYSVATDAFVAEGGDGFMMFRQALRRVDHQTPLRDVFLRTLEREPLQAEVDGRILILVPASP